MFLSFFFNDPATTEIYTLSLHDALPIFEMPREAQEQWRAEYRAMLDHLANHPSIVAWIPFNEGWGQHDTNNVRSEEDTSELQSRLHLVCRLLLEKKKNKTTTNKPLTTNT